MNRGVNSEIVLLGMCIVALVVAALGAGHILSMFFCGS
jgi:hypothetical protein